MQLDGSEVVLPVSDALLDGSDGVLPVSDGLLDGCGLGAALFDLQFVMVQLRADLGQAERGDVLAEGTYLFPERGDLGLDRAVRRGSQ